MKKYLIILGAILISSAVSSQTDVNFNFNNMLGEDEFALNYPVSLEGGYDLNISRLEYYISKISITHDGGQVTELTDLYLIIRPAEENVYSLGNHNIVSVENVSFGFGVDSSVNNLDPASYPSDHPLAYQSPSMHWGWSSGYRFICLEGNAGFGLLYDYQIHALGNNNYNYVSLNYNNTEAVSGVLNIGIDADYTQFFYDNSVQGGAIVHSDSHPTAIKTLYNAQNRVFNSEGGIVALEEINETVSFGIFPNPIQGNKLSFQLENWNVNSLKASVLDISGKLIFTENILSNSPVMDVSELSTGVYLLKLEDSEGRTYLEKFQK